MGKSFIDLLPLWDDLALSLVIPSEGQGILFSNLSMRRKGYSDDSVVKHKEDLSIKIVQFLRGLVSLEIPLTDEALFEKWVFYVHNRTQNGWDFSAIDFLDRKGFLGMSKTTYYAQKL